MSLNKSTGNMYDWVTHTWNPIKGACYHDCTYCYMKRWGKLKPVHLDEKELKTDLGSGNVIFVGSSCDIFAQDIPMDWEVKTINHCLDFDNTYLFQSKNPRGINGYALPDRSLICTTLETNRYYSDIMGKSPTPLERAQAMDKLSQKRRTYVTIEPVMDFDLLEMISLIKQCNPQQVNIGADSGRNNLPEPSKDKLLALIDELQKFTTIAQKRNLGRLLL